MKIYQLRYILLAILASMMIFSACNDKGSEDDPIDTSDLYVVKINSFKLKADDSILANLDSVFFSIDLNNARVFNADSLPLGTRVDSLGISMTTSSVAVADITMPSRYTGQDTVINYLESGSEAINFSKGYVTLHLESANKETKRDYRIYVNVHKMKPDSLAWGDAAWGSFPTSIAAPTATRSIQFRQRALCFATDGSTATRAICDNPADNNWDITSITIPEGLDIATITPGADALFALTLAGALMTSTDNGETWTGLGVNMTYIYGVYRSTVLGVNRLADGSYVYATYPESQSVAVPASAPVSGTSLPVTFVTEWSADPMLMIMGGTTAAGAATSSVWAYDGSQWADITMSAVPAMTGVTMVPYFSIKVGDDWVAKKETALLAFGGRLADGSMNRKLYLSTDRGVTWSLAGELMQLPEAVPQLVGAQALVFEKTLESRALSAWTPMELPVLPGWFTLADEATGIRPITSWQCPYIYLFGGTDSAGKVNAAVWRAVINRLSFKPLQ